MHRDSSLSRARSRAKDYQQFPFSGSSSDADDELDSLPGVSSQTLFSRSDVPTVGGKQYLGNFKSDVLKQPVHLPKDKTYPVSAIARIKKLSRNASPCECTPLNASVSSGSDDVT